MESSPAITETDSHSKAQHNPNGGSTESECLATAIELRQLLQEEAEVLGRFAGAELLWLTPRKESLINELGWKLDSLKRAGVEPLLISAVLKSILEEIDQLNRSNGLFIQRSLTHWQDFLTIFSPPSYSPAGDGMRPPVRMPRGRAFSREI